MRLVAMLFLLAGQTLLFLSRGVPRHDAGWEKAQRVVESTGTRDGRSRRWYSLEEAHRTAASRQQDLGWGLLTVGGTLLAIAAAARACGMRGVQELRSPSHPSMLWISALSAIAALVFASVCWLQWQADRGDFPWRADTIIIGMIPLFALGIIGAPLVAMVVFVTLRKAPHSVRARDLQPLTARFAIITSLALAVEYVIGESLYWNVVEGAFPIVVAQLFAMATVLWWWPAAAAPRFVDVSNRDAPHIRGGTT